MTKALGFSKIWQNTKGLQFARQLRCQSTGLQAPPPQHTLRSLQTFESLETWLSVLAADKEQEPKQVAVRQEASTACKAGEKCIH